ncbi:MAG: polyprenol monophosphomannose synthase [Candidatus Dormiibacterota bacterium]
MPDRALVIVPTYNERPNLEGLVRGIREQDCGVLVVDDNSPDGTGEVADQLAVTDSGVQVLHRRGKLGLGSAYIAGLSRGLERGFDLLITMDADGSHQPRHLPALIAAAGRRRGVVIGSRYVPGGAIVGWPQRRMLLSHGANLYCRTLLSIRVHDCTSGYRCYPREAVEHLHLESIVSDGYAFLIETLYRCLRLGIPVTEVPIRFEDRVAGRSKVSATEIGKALFLVPRLRWGRARASRARRRSPLSDDEIDLPGAPVYRGAASHQATREPGREGH